MCCTENIVVSTVCGIHIMGMYTLKFDNQVLMATTLVLLNLIIQIYRAICIQELASIP